MTDDRRIWKFPLAVTDYQTVKMPAGARVLSVDVVRTDLVAYALCNPNAEPRERTCLIVGTGNPIEEYAAVEWVETMDFIGTVQMLGGQLVWHVFFGQES
jgi:hypothetical protein